jgi:hypothetical protein
MPLNKKTVLSFFLFFQYVFAIQYSYAEIRTISISEIEEEILQARLKQNKTKTSAQKTEVINYDDAILNFYPELIIEIRDEITQEIEKGYIEKNHNNETAWFGQLISTVNRTFRKDLSEIKGGLAFEASDTSAITSFGYRPIGVHESGVYSKNGWTGLVTVFKSNKKKILVLTEEHYEKIINSETSDAFSKRVKDARRKSGSVQILEKINTELNGIPAILRSVESHDDDSISTINWDKDGVNYQLITGGNAGKKVHRKKSNINGVSAHKRFSLPEKTKIEDPDLEFLAIAQYLTTP